ncbi:hypothetical protein C3941_28570 [Kaistia algarum]|uniref:hypothetical protein n=1 Tax=Kaistia algarum TaxID=2083279 RepID=UPI000CE7FCBB|nr:hypothetical protein [Kaistia algarum]MCX5515380.1 hypothetical protein [Kaistia algarum]PPE76542.1 hypothetical protein C3941_28570 [Kaistia algarum]
MITIDGSIEELAEERRFGPIGVGMSSQEFTALVNRYTSLKKRWNPVRLGNDEPARGYFEFDDVEFHFQANGLNVLQIFLIVVRPGKPGQAFAGRGVFNFSSVGVYRDMKLNEAKRVFSGMNMGLRGAYTVASNVYSYRLSPNCSAIFYSRTSRSARLLTQIEVV